MLFCIHFALAFNTNRFSTGLRDLLCKKADEFDFLLDSHWMGLFTVLATSPKYSDEKQPLSVWGHVENSDQASKLFGTWEIKAQKGKK